MLAEKRIRAQPPTPMLMSIPPFKPPSVTLSGSNASSTAGIDLTSHAVSSQQYISSHPIHPLQQPPHQQQHPQKQYLHLIHPQQNVSLTAPTSHPAQSSQAIQNCPPPQQQYHPQHQQHQKVQSTHPRRGSIDRGTIKDPFKSRSSSISKAASECVGPYLLGKTLGKGSSGCVKLARHRKTNEQVAVKIISKASLVNRAAVHRGIEREIAIMKLINHPHVIRLYDVYETEKELFLVMEYVSGGELFEYLVNKGRLDETEALRFFQQIIVGLAFCHKRKICHRDLKPENLLLDDRMNVKIADFGMASLQKSGRLLETSCGSPHYASPEVVTGMKYDGSSSDIWSCGIILYALLTGHLPFDDENIRQLLSKVKAGKFYMPTDISAGARDLISRMLTVNPKRRITMQGVMMHPWFRMVNPERNTLGEPAQDPESGRSMQVEELDAEILLHMRWLFAPGPSHSNPEAKEVFDEEALLVEIQEKMINDEENMEKLFYHLLCQHKAELLENYIGDGNDIMPDAPRRRADSFPNSAACSVRSKTPEFGRSPLSPRDSPAASPASPLSPVIKGMDPTPLTLNPEPIATTSNSMHQNRMSEVKRGQSPVVMWGSNLMKNDATNTPSRQDIIDSENRSKTSFDGDQGASRSMRKDDSGRGEDVMKNDSKSTFSAKPMPGNGSAHESLISVNVSNNNYQAAMATTATEGIHPLALTSPCTAAQLPPLHPTEPAGLVSHPYSNSEEARKKVYVAVHAYDSTAPSIESQVMSTQISEISYSSSSACSAPAPEPRLAHQKATNGVGVISNGDVRSSLNTSSAEKVMSTASSIRGPRPILHPLDVKAFAGTTAMNISVPQHSRKYSEGTSSMISTTPLSPKRPWFARLFDFKPQPLMFKSHVSAVEAQERVETILKNLFHSNIQIDAYRKPAFGVKCRFEGGVIDEQSVKPVKFKVDISEKTVFLPVDTTSSSKSSRTVSSSAVAAMLATVELQNNIGNNNYSNSSSSSCSNNTSSGGISKLGPSDSSSSSSNGGCSSSIAPMTAAPPVAEPKRHIFSGTSKKSPAILAGRRASDGGSILSSAAAAMTSHFASKIHFNSNSNSNAGHRHSVHGIIPNMGGRGQGQAPQPQMQMRRVVKVTLHQQQGANSTLRMIYERLCVAWDIPLHLQEQDQEQLLVASPMGAATH